MGRRPFNPDDAVGGASSAPRRSAVDLVTVWQITQWVRDALDDALPATVHVVGQLSNAKRHGSGHFYFTLKDERSELGCVMWRSDAGRLKFEPIDGMDVVVTGAIGVFERSGRYQLYARRMEPRGVGALELAFRRLCEKLEREGLFDPAHKKPLPKYPARVAVVTSKSGAALQDILDTLRRRYPCVEVVMVPAAVQGDGAGASIARAIRFANRCSTVASPIEVMIVGRGGGSREDLAAFNEEAVARAIFASRIPVISAVGHETDVSVADLVADVRAATPTAAAELAVPRAVDVEDELSHRSAALGRRLRHVLDLAEARLSAIAARNEFATPLDAVETRRRSVQEAERMLIAGLAERVHRLHRELGDRQLALQALQPQRYIATQLNRLDAAVGRVRWAMNRRLTVAARAVGTTAERMLRIAPGAGLVVRGERLAALSDRCDRALVARQARAGERLAFLEARLTALSHEAVLSRGFSLTRLKKSGRLVRSVEAVREGDRVITELADGQFESRVADADQGELFD